jgi:hypothetical protein
MAATRSAADSLLPPSALRSSRGVGKRWMVIGRALSPLELDAYAAAAVQLLVVPVAAAGFSPPRLLLVDGVTSANDSRGFNFGNDESASSVRSRWKRLLICVGAPLVAAAASAAASSDASISGESRNAWETRKRWQDEHSTASVGAFAVVSELL